MAYTKEQINKYQRDWRRKNPEKAKISYKESSWRNQYGIKNMTYDRYLLMLKEQNNCCYLCDKNQNELERSFHVDHNHTTGEVRKLLCEDCNHRLGWYEKSKHLINKFDNYLKEHK